MTQRDLPGPRPVMEYANAPSRRRRYGLLGWVLFILLVVAMFAVVRRASRDFAHVNASDFDLLLKSSSIRSITIDGDSLYGDLVSQTTVPSGTSVTNYRVTFPPGMASSFPFMEYLLSNRGRASVSVADAGPWPQVASLLPWLLTFGFVYFFIIRPFRRTQPSTSV